MSYTDLIGFCILIDRKENSLDKVFKNIISQVKNMLLLFVYDNFSV